MQHVGRLGSLLTGLLLAGLVATAAAQDTPPMRVFGTARLAGQLAAPGTVIQAVVGSAVCGTGTVGIGGGYRVDVATAPFSPCASPGGLVFFTVGGQPARETLVVEPGAFVALDLTATALLAISAGGPYSGVAGQPLLLTAMAAGAVIPQFQWTFGDSSVGNGPMVTHIYQQPGSYLATVTVTDLTSGASGTASAPVTIGAGAEQVVLFAGCHNVVSTWPDTTAVATIAAAVSPPEALISLWRYHTGLGRFLGYGPQAPSVSDLTELSRLDAFFLCVDQPATLARPTR